MRKAAMVLGLVAGVVFLAGEAHAAVPTLCQVESCSDGKVFCQQIAGGGESLGGAGGAPMVSCSLSVFDGSCSEVAACNRRVPAVGGIGLSILGIAMATAGVLFARRRRR